MSSEHQVFDSRDVFHRALRHLEVGDIAMAEPLLHAVVENDSGNPGAVFLLGMCHHRSGRHASGLQLMDLAIDMNPDMPLAHYNRGLALSQLGRIEDAAASFVHAVALSPGYVLALHHGGDALQEVGRFDEALGFYDRVLVLEPNRIQVLNNRAVALQKLGRFDAALRDCERAISLEPAYAEAYCNLGMALQGVGRHEEALASYTKAAALKPDYVEAHYNLGCALHELKHPGEALQSYARAIELRPGFAAAHNNRGLVFQELGRNDEALACYDQAISRDDSYAEAHANRGGLLLLRREYTEAMAALNRAITLDASVPYAMGQWLHAKMLLCDWEGFDDAVARVLRDVDTGKKVLNPFPSLSMPVSAQQQLHVARAFMQEKFPLSSKPLWRGERYAHERIRVGYFSSDFRNHPVAALTARLFEMHDRTKFETFAFSFGPAAQDPMRARLQGAFEHFLDVQDHSDHAIATLARQHEIDIAVDLNGITGNGRPGVFALRPSPVQVNYLGYPGSVGAAYMDYIVADRIVIPPEHARYYSEKPVWLPHCFQVNDPTRTVTTGIDRREAGLPEQGFVFCSFSQGYKISPAVFDIWCRLLREVEGSVLWLTNLDDIARRNLCREAAVRGVAPARLLFAPHVASLSDHLGRLACADLVLDTFPYGLHTSGSDALWAGVPLVACQGDTFASRVSSSLLTAIGLPELIANSATEYETLALQLARDPRRLAALKEKLVRNRDTHPLFDAHQFTRHLEAAYFQMWTCARMGLPHQPFEVPRLLQVAARGT